MKGSAIDPKTVSRTYGFVTGQQLSLDGLRRRYPSLAVDITRAEVEFKAAFGIGFDEVKNDLMETFGQWFLDEMDKQFESLDLGFDSPDLTEQDALDFVQMVLDRSQGQLESPVLETLLYYQYKDRPGMEYIDGWRFEYQSDDHPKAKGIRVKLNIPYSWSQQEAERPNIVQKFIEQNGEGNNQIMLLVMDTDLEQGESYTNQEMMNALSEEGFKEDMLPGQTLLSAEKVKWDNLHAWSVQYNQEQNRLGITIRAHVHQFMTYYDDRMILLQTYTYGESFEEANKNYEQFYPLYLLVANSFVLKNQW
jgi:hypothetical protein